MTYDIWGYFKLLIGPFVTYAIIINVLYLTVLNWMLPGLYCKIFRSRR
jgi:hypothetical protein